MVTDGITISIGDLCQKMLEIRIVEFHYLTTFTANQMLVVGVSPGVLVVFVSFVADRFSQETRFDQQG